jgi:RHS repeat-associated protein
MHKVVSLFLTFILLSQPVLAYPAMGAANPLLNLPTPQLLPPTIFGTNLTYDIHGNLIRSTDALGNTTQFTYNLMNRLIQVIYPDNSRAVRIYDPVGNLVVFIDANNQITKYSYDMANRLIEITDALGNITRYGYDTEGNRLSATDANNVNTQYLYDSLNRLRMAFDPLGRLTAFNYDPAGNLVLKVDPSGNVIQYTYDALNRLVRKQYPDSTEETFAYDARGNMLSCANLDISYNFAYNALGRLISATDSNNRALAYEYDPVGNKIRMTTPEGKSVNYNYDPLNRLASLTDIHGKATTYTYDSLGRRTKITLPNSTTASYAYDSLNRLLSLVNKTGSGSTISSYAYTYDNAGNRLTRQEPHLKTTYAYDVLYQLTQASFSRIRQDERHCDIEDGHGDDEEDSDEEEGYHFRKHEPREHIVEGYTYDAVGNRLTALKDTYTYDIANQLLTNKRYGYEYDRNGNLKKKTELSEDGTPKTYTYSYDYENRLKEVLIEGRFKTKTVTFAYDPLGRRIKKSVKTTEHRRTHSKSTTYVYDSEDIILEYLSNDTSRFGRDEVVRFTHGPGLDEPISMERRNKLYYYHFDGLGSVTELTNSRQRTVSRLDYDSFGIPRHYGTLLKNPYAYTGREYDPEIGLYYYRNRYYDPAIGRFITQDPLGMVDGPNLYTYVNNNPVNWVDPWGWCKDKEDIKRNILKDIWRSHLQWHKNLRKSFAEAGPYGQGGPYVALAGAEIISLGTTLSGAGLTAIAGGGISGVIAGGGWVIIGAEVIWIGVDVMSGYIDSLKER